MKHLLFTVLALVLPSFSASAESQATILSTTFLSTENGMQGWTVNDANDDACTWKLSPSLNGLVYNDMTSHAQGDDWAFSPAFNLTAGQHYVLETTLALRGVFNTANLQYTLASSATPGAATQVITADTYNFHTGLVTRRYHFVAERNGTQYLGIHHAAAFTDGIIVLKSVRILATGGQCPTAAPDMTANGHPDTQSVGLKWYAPNRDTEGTIITRNMTAEVCMDDKVLKTIDNVKPASLCEAEVTPETFSGAHTFSVRLVLDGHRSQSTSRTINLDDFKGGSKEVGTFKIDSKASFEKWNIQNGFESPQWLFDYHSCYIGAINKLANAWLFTPTVDLEAGHRYTLSYEAKTSSSYPASFDITIGNAQDSLAHTRILETQDKLAVNGYATLETAQFEVSTSGTYCFGFHATYIGNSLDIRSATITEILSSGSGSGDAMPVWNEEAETILDDNDNPGVKVELPYHERLTPEGVDLYAAFVHTQLDEYTLGPRGIFSLAYDDGYNPSLTEPEKEISLSGGCVYHNGRLYAIEFNHTGNLQEETPHWLVLDAQTYDVMLDVPLSSGGQCTTKALAYNPKDNRVYGLLRDYTDSYIVAINPEDGTFKRLTDALDYRKNFLTLSCNADGLLYAIYLTEDYKTGDQRHFLARIDPSTGNMVDVGEIQAANLMPEDILYNMKYRQSLVCDNSTGHFYWMFGSSSMALGQEYAAIFELNPENAVATLRTWVTQVYGISGAYLTEPALRAPAAITDVEFIPESTGATSGTLSFNMPSLAYNGHELDEKLRYRITDRREGGILIEGESTPDAYVSLPFTAQRGVHTLYFTAISDAGEGITIHRQIVVGYDYPAAPTDVEITEDGRTITLTWKAPETGINGAPYNPDELRYRVVRYPGYDVVADGLQECRFTETLPSEISRYVYAVYSCNGDQAIEGAQSKMIVVGDPIEPPFGGIFRTEYDLYNYYTVIDNNADRYTWFYDDGTHSAYYPYNYAAPADDWLISPPLHLKTGKNYTLQFGTFSSNGDYPESLRVTLGRGKTPEAQRTVLLDLPQVPTMDEEGEIAVYQLSFDNNVDGTWYYAFQACSAAYCEYLFLYDIRFYESEPDGIEAVATTAPLTFSATATDGGIRTLSPDGRALRIFNAAGTLVRTTEKVEDFTSCPTGIYLVTDGKTSRKVIVR